MAVERSRTPDHLTEKGLVNVHLFNCDRTYNLESVEKLLTEVEANAKCEFSISKHYFLLPKMAETCAELAEYQMDFAIFVVHANESRLSLNEERAGIGYAKIYRALLAATGNRVLIVIGGDEYYEGEQDTQVLSRWAKLKILSQFSPEYLDGRKSFIFSWKTKHRLIHEDAILHFLDPQKHDQKFVPEYGKIAGKEEELEPQTDKKDNLVSSNDSQQPAAQQNICSVEAEEADEEFDILSNPDKKDDYNRRHGQANEGMTKEAQFAEILEEDKAFHTPVVGYEVDDESLNAAKKFAVTVGKKLNLDPLPVGTNTKSAMAVRKFLNLEEFSSTKVVILVVEKATAISGEKSFLDILTDVKEATEGRQVVVIVCKDKDWKAGQNMLVSQSMEDLARPFREFVYRENWVLYSWNEEDENFNTESHEDDLVKKVRNWLETQRLPAETANREVVNRATTKFHNDSNSPGASFEKVHQSNCPIHRSGGGLLRMTASLNHGKIEKTVYRYPDNWDPSPELTRGIEKLFGDKAIVDEVQIWEDEDGSHSIRKPGPLHKLAEKARETYHNINFTVKKTKTHSATGDESCDQKKL